MSKKEKKTWPEPRKCDNCNGTGKVLADQIGQIRRYETCPICKGRGTLS